MAARRSCCLAIGRSTTMRWLSTGGGGGNRPSSASTSGSTSSPSSPPPPASAPAAAKDEGLVEGDRLAQSFMLPWERAAFDRSRRPLSNFEKVYWGIFAGAFVSWALYSAWTTPKASSSSSPGEDPILIARRKKEAERELEMRRRERVLALATGQADATGSQANDLFDGMDPAEIDKYVSATMRDLRAAVAGDKSREAEAEAEEEEVGDLFAGLEPAEIDRLLAAEDDAEARKLRENAAPLLRTTEEVQRERDRLRRRY